MSPTILGNANAILAIPVDGIYSPPPPPFTGMIIQIDTNNTTSGGSPSDAIRLPFQPEAYHDGTSPSGLTLNIEVDWGDSSTSLYNTNPTVAYTVSHVYSSPGIYTIKIDSAINSIEGWSLGGGTSVANEYDRNKITNISQWGYFNCCGIAGYNYTQGRGYNFSQADQLSITATDTPLITGTSLESMFSSWGGLWTFEIPNLNSWDVSGVSMFSSMFGMSAGTNSPIGDVSSWNMSNATDISGMFSNTNFGLGLGSGDVSSWNVSNVTAFNSVFLNTPWNGDLSSWDVSNADTMAGMFQNCYSFTGIGLNNWILNTTPNYGSAGIANLNNMFAYCPNFNTDISSWNFSKVGQCGGMFTGATSFNQNISAWDMSGTHYVVAGSNIGTIYDMFNGGFGGGMAFDQDLSSWDFSATTCIIRFGGPGNAGDLTLSPTNYDATLIGFATRIPYTNAKTSAWCGAQIWEFGLSQYNLSNAAAVTARNALIADMGAIVDGGGI
jgi:surface protein